MPRTARIDWTGAVQHTFSRGVEKRVIFLDDQDHEQFKAVVHHALEGTGTRCFAWSLMKDHYHLAIQPGEGGVSRVMHCINTGYAMYFNKRWNRVGHLFQGRFGSQIHDGEDATQGLIGYVHGNPLAAGICRTVRELDDYPWSGQRELMGIVPPSLIDVDAVLRLFGKDRDSARAALIRRLERECSGPTQAGLKPDLRTVNLASKSQFCLPAFGLECIVTPPQNLARIAREAKDRSLRHGVWRSEGGTTEALATVICLALGARLDDLRAGRRTPREMLARSIVAHIACDLLAEPGASVARVIGVTRQAVTKARNRGREMLSSLELVADTIIRDALVFSARGKV